MFNFLYYFLEHDYKKFGYAYFYTEPMNFITSSLSLSK